MATGEQSSTAAASPGGSFLRAMHLASPTLPIGAFAYSQGLEQAVEQGWVSDEASAADWVLGLLRTTLTYVDIPLLGRLHAAWTDGDASAVRRWSRYAFASRESKELQAEERHLGSALTQVLVTLDVDDASDWTDDADVGYLTMFALGAARWDVAVEAACLAYVYAWSEHQVSAATRLIPLGQQAGQRVLSAAIGEAAGAVARGLAVSDDDIGFSAHAFAIASVLHERQYTRLFRS